MIEQGKDREAKEALPEPAVGAEDDIDEELQAVLSTVKELTADTEIRGFIKAVLNRAACALCPEHVLLFCSVCELLCPC